ncbi:glycoside hydrolase family 19 protein [Pelagibaculum spongiae]|uniref:Glycoside hydrolase family 19 n=1 Tax=Pelagibaculum spongiae TaxID=2080658 RepID=A0A2V1GZX8_9GAMM|nr:glycoside hydrolase family 19 protein [Pelagibaculum spongiae]PVZ71763.1 glycoside hydrolase family 19 [Pelagibaculum spongiae]
MSDITEAHSDVSLLTVEKLSQLLSHDAADLASKYFLPLEQQMQHYQINTPLRQAHFLAQLIHESGGLRYNEENLNYSSEALRSVFGKYFESDEMANACARAPEQIANIVYANRMGNGDDESGDGWRYRGRGLIQLTGHDNYQLFADACGIDVISDPDLIAKEIPLSVATATWYWDHCQLNQLADKDDLREITRHINGGDNGLEDRQRLLDDAKNMLQI